MYPPFLFEHFLYSQLIKSIIFFTGLNWAAIRSLDPPSVPCPPAHCQNEGVCLPGPASVGPTCLCQPGFLGPTCAIRATSCNENPCAHGARCTEDLGGGPSYTCHCSATGHYGRNCQLPLSACVVGTDGCQNGGACLDQPGATNYLCDCPEGYTGRYCEIELRASLSANLVRETRLFDNILYSLLVRKAGRGRANQISECDITFTPLLLSEHLWMFLLHLSPYFCFRRIRCPIYNLSLYMNRGERGSFLAKTNRDCKKFKLSLSTSDVQASF